MTVQPVPDGFHTVTPYLVVEDVAALIDFLTRAFDAKEVERTTLPDGRVMHSQVQIGDSMVMMGETREKGKTMPATLYLYVADTDASYAKAVAAGGESLMEPADQFYGDRNAGVKDSQGNHWWIGTHIEDVSEEEMAKRVEAMGKGK